MRVIEVQHLWKSFKSRQGTVEALRGISLHVEAGEVFGFLGPNGAGKTTTLRILATLLSPDKGHAIVAGHDLLREPGKVRACGKRYARCELLGPRSFSPRITWRRPTTCATAWRLSMGAASWLKGHRSN